MPQKVYAATDEAVYKSGIYCYNIISEEKKEVKLVGIEFTNNIKELDIPGTVVINDNEYKVLEVSINWRYYTNKEYLSLYKNITKINVSETFTGTILDIVYAFNNIEAIEFYGKTAPKRVSYELWNQRKALDVLIIVPIGSEAAYRNVFDISINYYNGSDLTEKSIFMSPTIVSKVIKDIEYGCFQVEGFIYQVTKSAKNGMGKVQLVGLTKILDYSYLALPEKVRNNGYTYQLTKICTYGLIGARASVIVIPNTVTSMDSHIFDYKIQLLFLSKNVKVLPRYMIDSESYPHLTFVHVPEGVTTISDYAFSYGTHTGSIILPTTIKSIGKNSLNNFKRVTFLKKKPISSILPSVAKNTIVKVNKANISEYKSILNKKVTLIAAKNIIKSTKIAVNTKSINMATLKTQKLTAKLSKGSNENIYWLSSNTDILQVSDKGVVKAKKAGIYCN